MKILLTIMSLLCLISISNAQNPGDLDSTFNANGRVQTGFGAGESLAGALAVQSNGKILAAGSFYNGTDYDFALARYNTNGSLDTTFDGDGKLTLSFGAGDDFALAVAVQSDGKIVVAGEAFNGADNDFAVARINADGSLDTGFDGDGKLLVDFGAGDNGANKVALQGDGKIVVAGYASNGSNDDFALARLNTNGSPDTTFDEDGKVALAFGASEDYIYALGIQTDGKIVAAGKTYGTAGDDFAVARFNADGSLDTGFNGTGKVLTGFGTGFDAARGLAIQTNGKIVVAGESFNGTNGDFALARYNADGSLDTSFDGDGKQTTNFGSAYDYAFAVIVQSDGKIVAAGTSGTDFGLVRYSSTGALDTGFSGDGKQTIDFGNAADSANAVVLDDSGKILLAGQSGDSFALARITAAAPTAANVSVAGRVYASFGRGLSGASVRLTDETGATRTVRTNVFGNYRFENVAAGRTYIIAVEAKRFAFREQAVSVGESLAGLDFYPSDGKK